MFLPIFHVRLAACHKMALKKSSMVKIAESERKYGIYLFKVETFLSNRHQVNMYLSTFQVHVLEILMLRRFYFKYQRIPLLIKSPQKCQTPPRRVVQSAKMGYQSNALLKLGDTIGLSD